jgi:hypothetical protein
MVSWLMGYFGQWDQIEPNLPVTNYSNVCSKFIRQLLLFG